MTKLFEARTASELWGEAITSLLSSSHDNLQNSRQGNTIEHLHCCLHLENPRQRWVLSRRPAINPAFAIAEIIWILKGRNDAAFLNFWNRNLPNYSGFVTEYPGAYGKRLREHFGCDQIERAYESLLHNPESRQVVLQIWDSRTDLPLIQGDPRNTDIPCNIASMLKVRAGKLEWTQLMRSNDLYRGTPYNIIQFTSMQEIMAGWLNLDLGSFVLFTDSLHIYEKDIEEIGVVYAPLSNQDSLMLSKLEFDEIFPLVVQCMEDFQNPSFAREEITQLKILEQLPISWRNLLYIVAAELARRKGWLKEMQEVEVRCKNTVLRTAWKNWLERFESN